MTIEEIIDLQMQAFNNRSIKEMMPLYTEDIKIYNFSDHQLTVNGIKECEEMFRQLFEQSPNLYAEIIKTIFFDTKAIVHDFRQKRRQY